jgi:hypothetical protein
MIDDVLKSSSCSARAARPCCRARAAAWGRLDRRRFVGRAVGLCLATIAACTSEERSPVGAYEQALGAAGSGSCVPGDTTTGGACTDQIDQVAEGFHYSCPRGARILRGTRNNDELHGTSGRDCIFGLEGNDTIYGEGGDDVIYGGSGDDRIIARGGSQLIYGGDGADTIDVSGASASQVYGENGADKLTGGSGKDNLNGGADNDVLNGGDGRDTLSGGDCHDLLVGGRDSDTGDGGNDYDACDTESSSRCERTGNNRVLCSRDTDCRSSERCAVNSGFCVPRTAAKCGAASCTPTGTTDTTCNGVDDDCDGAIDDDFPSQPTSCGVGACASTGARTCRSGAVVDSCAPGAPPSSTDATCDGRDDDCSGAADEDFTPGPSACGLGVCASTGNRSCIGGVLLDSCVPGAPTAIRDDSCNGLDDDCNGSVDDAFVGEPTECGVGVCRRTGFTSCEGGNVVDSCHVDCEGGCNDGDDDDFDGVTDCGDPDCNNVLYCLAGSFGSPCANEAQCDRVGPDQICDTGLPGGYCTRPCTGGCPEGTFCLGGIACVVDCGPGMNCGRAAHSCTPLAGEGLPPTPFCHP